MLDDKKLSIMLRNKKEVWALKIPGVLQCKSPFQANFSFPDLVVTNFFVHDEAYFYNGDAQWLLDLKTFKKHYVYIGSLGDPAEIAAEEKK